MPVLVVGQIVVMLVAVGDRVLMRTSVVRMYENVRMLVCVFM